MCACGQASRARGGRWRVASASCAGSVVKGPSESTGCGAATTRGRSSSWPRRSAAATTTVHVFRFPAYHATGPTTVYNYNVHSLWAGHPPAVRVPPYQGGQDGPCPTASNGTGCQYRKDDFPGFRQTHTVFATAFTTYIHPPPPPGISRRRPTLSA